MLLLPDGLTQTAALADTCYQSIKTAIIEDELKPGTVLQERALAESLNVSRTPVREALQRLAQDGLVEIMPGKGAIVKRFTAEDVREILEIREVLEGLAAGLVAEAVTEEDLNWLERLLAPAEEHLSSGRYMEVHQIDLQFHAFLAAKAGNSRLLTILSMLSDQIRRMTNLSREDRARAAESILQHRAIYEALKAGDPVGAQEAMKEHIRSVKAYLFRKMGFR